MKTILRTAVAAGSAALILSVAGQAQNAPSGAAPTYPQRQVRIIVPTRPAVPPM